MPKVKALTSFRDFSRNQDVKIGDVFEVDDARASQLKTLMFVDVIKDVKPKKTTTPKAKTKKEVKE